MVLLTDGSFDRLFPSHTNDNHNAAEILFGLNNHLWQPLRDHLQDPPTFKWEECMWLVRV